MIKIKITVLTEKGKKKIIETEKTNRSGKIVSKLAGISAEQQSDSELIVTLKRLNVSIYPVLEDQYRKVFKKRGLEENKDYSLELIA